VDNLDLTADPDGGDTPIEGDVSVVGADVIRPPVEDADPLDETDPDPDERAVDNRPFPDDDLAISIDEAAIAAVTPDTSWYSDSQDSFTLTTAAQLLGFSELTTRASQRKNFENKTVALGADIWLTQEWVPVGDFRGTFDGKGHTVYGVEISDDALLTDHNDNVGFFSRARYGGIVKNLTLSVKSIRVGKAATRNVGAVAAEADYLENCHVVAEDNGKIIVTNCDSYASIGGLVGDGTSYRDLHGFIGCSAAIDLVVAFTYSGASSVDFSVGGLAGSARLNTVRNSRASGNVTVTKSDANASSRNVRIGGLAGRGQTVENCYASGNVTADFVCMLGGLVGSTDNCGSNVSLTNSHASGAVTGGFITGGLVGLATGAVSACSATGAVTSHNREYNNEGNSSGINVRVGGLVGHLQGWAKADDSYASIVNSFASGDVSARGATSTNEDGAGGLVGYLGANRGANAPAAEIQNSYASGDVKSKGPVGGFVGNTGAGSTIINCYAEGDVYPLARTASYYYYEDYSRLGGFVGFSGNLVGVASSSTVTYHGCYARGDIYVYDFAKTAGGFAGYQYSGGEMDRCSYEGAIRYQNATSGGFYLGGLIGRLNSESYTPSFTIKNSYAISNIAVTIASGANLQYDNGYIGGLIAIIENPSTQVRDSYAVLGVSGVSAMENIKAGTVLGDIDGGYEDSSTQMIFDVYSNDDLGIYRNSVTGQPLSYPVFGNLYIENFPWLTANDPQMQARTEVQLKTKGTYTWDDFDQYWTIDTVYKEPPQGDEMDPERTSYPRLKASGLSSLADITAVTPSAAVTVGVGQAFAALPLPATVTATAGGANVTLGVTWERGNYQPVLGEYTLSGQLVLPAHISNSGNLTASVKVIVSDAPPEPPEPGAKAVAVGAQSGTLTAGTPGTVTFPVTTENIDNGSHDATLAPHVAGVSVQGGKVAINNNSGTLTLAGSNATVAGTYSNLTLTIGGAVSPPFTLTVGAYSAPKIQVTGLALSSASLPAFEVGETATLTARVSPSNASDKTLAWAVTEGADYVSIDVSPDTHTATLTAAAAGTATITVTATDENNEGTKKTATCTVTVVPAVRYPDSLRLAPSYTLVTAGSGATLLHGLDSELLGGMEWWFQKDGGEWVKGALGEGGIGTAAGITGLSYELLDNTEKGISVTTAAGIYRVRATTPGVKRGSSTVTLTATATIEVVPAPSGEDNTAQASLLGGNASGAVSVTANPALADGNGAAVPFQVTEATSAFLATLSNKENIGKENIVKLYTGYGTESEAPVAGGLSAALLDSRTIEIRAGAGAAKASRVTAVIEDDGVKVALGGTLNIAVKAVYPKITFAASKPLNAYYPESEAAAVTATTDVGAAVTEIKLALPANASAKTVASLAVESGEKFDRLKVLGTASAGNYSLTATVKVAGYKAVSRTSADTVAATFRVINDRPKLKLSAGTLTLGTGMGAGYAYSNASFSIFSSDAARPLDEYWQGLDLDKTKVYEDSKGKTEVKDLFQIGEDGTVTIPAAKQNKTAIPKTKYYIWAVTEGGNPAAPIKLTLTVKWADYTNKKPTFKLSPATITVNSAPAQQGNLIEVAVTPSAANLARSDWAAAAGLPEGFIAPGSDRPNTLTLITGGVPKAGKATVNTSEGLFKEAKLTIKVTGNSASFSMKQKGKIDLLDPASTIAVTAAFKNTASQIADIELYDSNNGIKGEESQLFAVVMAGSGPKLDGNTFYIKAKDGAVFAEGRKKQDLIVRLILVDNASEPALEARLAITPTQSSVKARASRSTVTLYNGQPDAREELTLALTSSGGGAALGAASIAGTDSPFELVRTGQGTWALGFKDGATPDPKTYTVTLQLWPEGTYTVDGDTVKPNGSGNTAAKPATVKVKVVVKG
jgi:hypothetical protein